MINSPTRLFLIVFAWTFLIPQLEVQAQARQVTHTFGVEYTEPKTNEDGTPLTDLAGTVIEYRYDGPGMEWVSLPIVPATSPTGGGIIQKKDLEHTFAAAVDVSQITTLEVAVKSLDESGNTKGFVSKTKPVAFDVIAPESVTHIVIESQGQTSINITVSP